MGADVDGAGAVDDEAGLVEDLVVLVGGRSCCMTWWPLMTGRAGRLSGGEGGAVRVVDA